MRLKLCPKIFKVKQRTTRTKKSHFTQLNDLRLRANAFVIKNNCELTNKQTNKQQRFVFLLTMRHC